MPLNRKASLGGLAKVQTRGTGVEERRPESLGMVAELAEGGLRHYLGGARSWVPKLDDSENGSGARTEHRRKTAPLEAHD